MVCMSFAVVALCVGGVLLSSFRGFVFQIEVTNQ